MSNSRFPGPVGTMYVASSFSSHIIVVMHSTVSLYSLNIKVGFP